MKCTEASEKLLDVAEGALDADEEQAVRAHLDECPRCRSEFAAVDAGVRALRTALPVLAPRDRYLTRARRERVLSGDGPQIFRLATYRQFVGAAAAAAILVSAAFITARLLGIRDARRLEERPAVAAQAKPAVHRAPVIVSAPGPAEPINVAYTLEPAVGEVARREGTPMPVRRTDTPGLTVPVNHAFYDPEESSHWW